MNTTKGIIFEEVTVASVGALQGPGCNALVENPFAVEDVEVASVGALQGAGCNALVENPF